MNVWYELGSLIPSICVGLLFWFVMRAILNADRREREAERAVEQEEARATRAAVRTAGDDATTEGPAAGPIIAETRGPDRS